MILVLEKVRYLEQMCEALRQQVKELVAEKEKRDSELEKFQEEIDVRVQEWKVLVLAVSSKEGESRDNVLKSSLF